MFLLLLLLSHQLNVEWESGCVNVTWRAAAAHFSRWGRGFGLRSQVVNLLSICHTELWGRCDMRSLTCTERRKSFSCFPHSNVKSTSAHEGPGFDSLPRHFCVGLCVSSDTHWFKWHVSFLFFCPSTCRHLGRLSQATRPSQENKKSLSSLNIIGNLIYTEKSIMFL